MLIADKIFVRSFKKNEFAGKTRSGVSRDRFLERCSISSYVKDGMKVYVFRDGSYLLSGGGVLSLDF